MQITLPWPSPTLSPNARAHWGRISSARKKYRRDCYYAALAAGRPQFWEERIKLRVEFYPPDNKHRDEDNMLASIKSGLDGVADAWKVNDKRFRIAEMEVGPKVRNGCVKIEVKNG
jgi:crossover junction endodeoxyribonuclease RusA